MFVLAVGLAAFWGAALRFLPLSSAPLWAFLGVGAGIWAWKSAPENRVWARQNWRALAVSDAVFLGAWGAFLTLRLLHPEAGDLEKPMDAALLGAAWKADYLPFGNPWFGGAPFVGYYYFGPLLGALLARILATPPHIAYNLVQAAFCAFFLSVLWSVGAALARSKSWGVAVVILVGLSGPLEPLRQRLESGVWWPLDWWKTSRVIPDTINEYPAFTLAIGDAHAHFYALSLAALWLALGWNLFAASTNRRLILGVCGLVLGAWLMTNTWDAPVFTLLLGGVIWSGRRARAATPANTPTPVAPTPVAATPVAATPVAATPVAPTSVAPTPVAATPVFTSAPEVGLAPADARLGAGALGRAALSFVAVVGVALLAAAPYFWRYKAQISGAVFELWTPDLASFALLWGGWGVLGILTLILPAARDEGARLRRLLVGAGLVALVAPFVFYIRGAFGDGPLRHQDTVFKFGLQAWVLLGTGISTELGARLSHAWRARAAQRWAVTALGAAFVPLLLLAPASVFWTRAVAQGTTLAVGQSVSPDAMRFLPQAEQQAIVWLQTNGQAGEIVMEGVKLDQGNLGGDYDAGFARVGAFSGLSSTLGWPDHARVWGADYGAVQERGRRIANLYALGSPLEAARGAADLGARFTFFGRQEGNWAPPPADVARQSGFSVHGFAGADGSRAMVLERIGR